MTKFIMTARTKPRFFELPEYQDHNETLPMTRSRLHSVRRRHLALLLCFCLQFGAAIGVIHPFWWGDTTELPPIPGDLPVHPVLLDQLDHELVRKIVFGIEPNKVADGMGCVFRIRKQMRGEVREHYLIPCNHAADIDMARRIMKSLPSTITPPRYFQQYDFLPISRRNKLNACRGECDPTYDLHGKAKYPGYETGYEEQFPPEPTIKNGVKHYESQIGFDDDEWYKRVCELNDAQRKDNDTKRKAFFDETANARSARSEYFDKEPMDKVMIEEKTKEWVLERQKKYQNKYMEQTLLKYGASNRREAFSINEEGDLLRNAEIYNPKKDIGAGQVQYAMCSDPVTAHCIGFLKGYLFYSHNIGLFEPGYPLCRDIHYASSIDALEKTGALVLLGANHFYRSTGVLNRLKNMGWTLSRVPCPAWVDPMLPEGLSSRVLQEYIDLINERRCPKCKGSGKEELGAWEAFFTDASAPKPDCTTCNGSGFVLPQIILLLKSDDVVFVLKGKHKGNYGVIMDPASKIYQNKKQWRVKLDNGEEIATFPSEIRLSVASR